MNWKQLFRMFLFGTALFIAGYMLSCWLGSWINLSALKDNKNHLLEMVNNNYLFSVVCFIASYVALVALSIPISSLFTLAGGFLFGTFFGALYSNIGGTLGALVAFTIFKLFLTSRIQRKYGDKLQNFSKHLKKEGSSYVLVMHLATVIPYLLINMFAAAARMPVGSFIWTTFVGIIPGSLVYAYAGSQLSHINKMSDVFSPKVILAFALMISLAVGSMLWKKYRKD